MNKRNSVNQTNRVNRVNKVNYVNFLPLALSSLLLALCLILPDRASSGSGPYTNSAHGDTTYGVKRSAIGFPTDYARGNCAHCHEQHASIGGTEPAPVTDPQGYELFYGTITSCDMVCFRCHGSSLGVEMQVDNYLYCMNFGGRALAIPGIYLHFCASYVQYNVCGSRHHLGRIYTTITNSYYGWGYPYNRDPCSACHNVHLAQRIGAKQYHEPYNPSKSPIQRVTEHNDPTKRLNLWGDDATEKMSYYVQINGGQYQAPYYGNTTSGLYEPAGDNTQNGSNLPDYVTFCMDCHKYAFADPDRSEATVKAIDWSADRHGTYLANNCTEYGTYVETTVRAPYTEFANSNYVLSCTDCHEPHGSPNRLHLIRRFVNGEDVAAETLPDGCDYTDDWIAICSRCHNLGHSGVGACAYCHGHGKKYPGAGGCINTPSF